MPGTFYPCGVPGSGLTDPIIVKDDASEITDLGVITAILNANGDCLNCLCDGSGECSCNIVGFTGAPIAGDGSSGSPFVIPEVTVFSDGNATGVTQPGNGTIDVKLRGTSSGGNILSLDASGGLSLECPAVLTCLNVDGQTVTGTGTVGDPLVAQTFITPVDTDCIDVGVTGTGTAGDPFLVSADIIPAAAQGPVANAVSCIAAEGLFAPKAGADEFSELTAYSGTLVNTHQTIGLSVISEDYVDGGHLLSVALDNVEQVHDFTPPHVRYTPDPSSFSSLQKLVDNQAIATLGRNSAGDNWSADYRYKDAGRPTADGGFFFDGPGVDDYIELRNQSFADVTKFGAYADGTNAAATTAAFVAAVATGKNVYVPPGDYRLNDEITLANNDQAVFGDGAVSSITQETADKNIFLVSAARNVSIRGLRLIQKGDVIADFTKNNCIYASSSTGLIVERNILENHTAGGVQLRNTKSTRVANNLSYNVPAANVHSSGADILCWGGNKDVTISGNHLFSDHNQNIYYGALDGDRGAVISGNISHTLDANFDPITPTKKRHGIILSYAANAAPISVVCEANVIANTTWSGIYINGAAEGLVVDANHIRDTAQNAPSGLGGGIQVLGGTTGRIVISNNVISEISAGTPGGLGCIGLQGGGGSTPDALVIGNRIDNANIYGIYVSSGDKVRLIANQITNITQTESIRCASASGLEGVISHNIIKVPGNQAGIFVDSGNTSKHVVVDSNHIDCVATRPEFCLLDDGGLFDDKTTDFLDSDAGDVLPLPAAPDVNDAAYFGFSNNNARDMTLACATQGAGTWTIVWEFWNGTAWVSLPGLTDGTSGFKAAVGNHVVSWTTPTDWAITTVASVTAFWVRARVGTFSSITTQPAYSIGYQGIYTTNYGIGIRFHNYTLQNNYVRGFAAGFYSSTQFVGRALSDKVRMNGQTFDTCFEGYVLRGAAGGQALIPVSETKNIHTTPFGGGGFVASGNECTILGGRIITRRSAVPIAGASAGTWAVGDVVENTVPTAGGTWAWVCTTAGTGGGTAVFKIIGGAIEA